VKGETKTIQRERRSDRTKTQFQRIGNTHKDAKTVFELSIHYTFGVRRSNLIPQYVHIFLLAHN